jgi:hypothetical protein
VLCGSERVIARLPRAPIDVRRLRRPRPGAEAEFDYGWEERWIRDEGYLKIVSTGHSGRRWRLRPGRQGGHAFPHAQPDSGGPLARSPAGGHRGVGDPGAAGRDRGGTRGPRIRWCCWCTRSRPRSRRSDPGGGFRPGGGRRGARGHRGGQEPARATGRARLARAAEGRDELPPVPRVPGPPAARQGDARGVRQAHGALDPLAEAGHALRDGGRPLPDLRQPCSSRRASSA